MTQIKQGGGSTFGVILSATFKTVPIPFMAWLHFEITQTPANISAFWLATAYFHSQLPSLVRNGVMGYYNISSIVPTNPRTPLQLVGGFWILNSTITTLDAVFTPVLNDIRRMFDVGVKYSNQFVPDMYQWWKITYPPGAVATVDVQLGSRLLDEAALSVPLPTLANALQTSYPDLVLLGNLVSGPGVWNAQPPGGLGSMTPAWRKAVVHLSEFSFVVATYEG